MPNANARSPSLSFGDYARNRCSPCSHRTQRETARLSLSSHRTQRETARVGMRISVTNARSPSLSFGDYARNSRSQCSHRTQRETARFNLLKTNLKYRRPVFTGNKKTFLFGMIGNPIQHFGFGSGCYIVFTHNTR